MPNRVAPALLASVTALAGCGGGASEPTVSSPARVVAANRGLPSVAPGGRCPVSRRAAVSARYAPALGPGPVYPVGFGPRAVLKLSSPHGYHSHRWGGAKILWVRRGIRGDVVVRGRRLDGAGLVRFEFGDVPPDHLVLGDPTDSGWADYPSSTRIADPGCYAYVVDGPGLREVIVFRAVD